MTVFRNFAIVLVCLIAALWIAREYFYAPPVQSAPVVVEFLQEFTLPDLDNQPRSILEWSGQPLIINFWATWCAPCRREMPLLQSLQDERKDGSLQVIGIALDNLSDAMKFVERIGVTYPILYGEDNATEVAESFGDDFVALPFTVTIAPGGEILTLSAGELDSDYLEKLATEMDAIRLGKRSVSEARERLMTDRAVQ
jgi:thiol-disulfide isomerase/thioredoxin